MKKLSDEKLIFRRFSYPPNQENIKKELFNDLLTKS